jgi:glycerophosphoryl diester phosphodiesterase
MWLIAHRGASAHAPENTMAAFKLALEMGARAMELDVHQSRDGRLVVIHDEDFKRVGGRKDKVGSLSWGEALKIDVGSWFGEGFSLERVPLLENVMDLLEGKAELHIEIKHGSKVYPGIEDKLAETIASRRAWDWAPVSSFDHEALKIIRGLEPRLRLGYLLGWTRITKAYREMEELRAESLNLSLRQVDSSIVQECHRQGRKVLVYTVNRQMDIERLARMAVDAVFTNFLELKVP